MQCMIFAAGMGTRLKPLTDTMPKALVPIGGEPLLKRLLNKLKKEGFERNVINVHHFGEQIIDYLRDNNNFGLDILVSDERERLLDTGGGLLKAKDLFLPNQPILIHNVDILSNLHLSDLMRAHSESRSVATLVVSQRQSSRYLFFDNVNHLCGWTNSKTGETILADHIKVLDAVQADDIKVSQSQAPAELPSNLRPLAFAGIHVISPHVFDVMTEMGFAGAFPIMQFYLRAMNTHTIKGHVPHDFQVMDVGKIADINRAHEFATLIGQEAT
ncbi:MAG: NTP transferase domain-containing protein [Paludibacteraceae bacterium]|nr:NTP transferase domain-containing protein [Paludibacteraceae bacterium]